MVARKRSRAFISFLLKEFVEEASVVNLTLLDNDLRAVIPAKAGIQIKKTGFRIRSGMTKYVK
jgi:hypothetical protein